MTATARSAATHLRAGLAKALSSFWSGARAAFRWAADQVPEVLLLGGAAAITYGAAQVYRAAGWLVGGVLALLLGWRLGRVPSGTPPAGAGGAGVTGG